MPLITNIYSVNNQFTLNVNDINVSRSTFYCNNLFTDASLTLQLNNMQLLKTSDVIIVQFIFNSVHSRVNNFIRHVRNGNTNSLVTLWNNLDPTILDSSHYVKQRIKIMFNTSRNQFVALSQVERFDQLHRALWTDSKIIEIQDTSLNTIYKPNAVISELNTSMDESIANKMHVNWQMENMLGDDLESEAFDRYILNIYDEMGILEDTSGNEADDVNKYVTTNASFTDCQSSSHYTTKVFKVYTKQISLANQNEYQFVLSNQSYRIKQIELKQSKPGFIASLVQLRYKEKLSDTNYAIISSAEMIITQSQLVNGVTTTTYKLNSPTGMTDVVIKLSNSLIDTISITCDVYENE